MTDKEQQDIVALKINIEKEKKQTIEYMLFSRKNSLDHTGFKTIEELYKHSIDRLQKTLDKLTTDHIKKYPD